MDMTPKVRIYSKDFAVAIKELDDACDIFGEPTEVKESAIKIYKKIEDNQLNKEFSRESVIAGVFYAAIATTKGSKAIHLEDVEHFFNAEKASLFKVSRFVCREFGLRVLPVQK
jgi:transcription initiation factor TFIIIB Brf1 subunit/transcription initiation factor TFIIB